jgi:hypothetical protein
MRSHLTRLLRAGTLSLTLLAGASTAAAAEVNDLTAVELRHAPEETVIRVRGDEAPTYSVFALRSPLRLFVDISRSTAAGALALPKPDGIRVSALELEREPDGQRDTQRLVLTLGAGVLYDVTGAGNDLIIKLVGGPVAGGSEQSAAAREAADRVRALEQKLDGEQRELAERRAELAARERDLEAALTASREKEKTASASAGSNADELARLAKEREALAARQQALEGERKQTLERASGLARDNDELGRLKGDLEKQRAELAARDRELKAASAALESRNDEVTRQQERVRAQQAELEQQKRAQAAGDQKRTAELAQERDRLAAQLAARDAQIADLVDTDPVTRRNHRGRLALLDDGRDEENVLQEAEGYRAHVSTRRRATMAIIDGART